MTEVRLQKILARAGVCSRRRAESVITAGRVAINGEVVREMGVKVDPRRDAVTVDGRAVVAERREYWLLHKPPGVIATVDDPWGRATVRALVDTEARVFPVGRLGADSAGLLLLTNDGEIAHRLTDTGHPLEETYEVLVVGRPGAADIRRLRRGVAVGEGRVTPLDVRVVGEAVPVRARTGAVSRARLRIVTCGEAKRLVPRALDAVGHPVQQLRRVQWGPLALGDLPEGAARSLGPAERQALRAAAGLD